MEVPVKTEEDVGGVVSMLGLVYFTCSYVQIWHLKQFAALRALLNDRLLWFADRGVGEGSLGWGLLNVELLQLGLALLWGGLGEEAVGALTWSLFFNLWVRRWSRNWSHIFLLKGQIIIQGDLWGLGGSKFGSIQSLKKLIDDAPWWSLNELELLRGDFMLRDLLGHLWLLHFPHFHL